MRKFVCLIVIGLPLLLASAPSAKEIELPPGFPPLRDDVDVNKPLELIPVNPLLAQQKNYQPLGLNLQPELLSPDYLKLAEKIDFGTYRLVIREEDFRNPESPNYFKLFSIVDMINEQGRELILTIDTSYLNPNVYSGTFKLLADKLGDRVRYYQILDRINLRAGVSLRDYHETLTLIRAIREAQNMKFKIVLGGIQGLDTAFLKELSDLYILDRVDAIAFNLYPYKDSMELPEGGVSGLSTHSIFRAVLLFQDIRYLGKPIFITDLGISTAFSPLGVSQLEQASMLSRATIYLLNGGASKIILNSLMDTSFAGTNASELMGICQADGSYKPAFYVMKNLADILRGAFFVSPPYLFQMHNQFPADNDPLFAYHLFKPAESAIYFIYWTPVANMYDRRTSLAIYRPALQPLYLTDLLRGKEEEVLFNRGANIIVFGNLPLSHIPTYIKMNLGESGG